MNPTSSSVIGTCAWRPKPEGVCAKIAPVPTIAPVPVGVVPAIAMTSARPVASVIAWPSAGKKVMSSMSDEKVTSTPEMPWPWLSLRVATIPIRSDLLASTELGLTFSTSRPELLLFRMNCSSVLPLLPPPPPVLPQLTTTAASASAATPPVIHFRPRIVVRPCPITAPAPGRPPRN